MTVQAGVVSPKRQADLEPNKPGFNIHHYSDVYYRHFAKTATEDLADFSRRLTPHCPVVVTYFDEARALGESLWCMLRLLSQQETTTPMWYVFMDTRSTVSYFNPAPGKSECWHLTCMTVPYLMKCRIFEPTPQGRSTPATALYCRWF